MAGPQLPVDIDRSYPNSRTDPTIRAHQRAHDAVHRIVNTIDVSLATAEVGQVLTWNGSTYAPAASASPTASGSQKSWEDAARALHAVAPSPESGLDPIKADGETDDAPAIQKMLDHLKSTYGGGQLFVPVGRTSRCNSTITIPSGVQVVGSETSEWDFWYAGTDVTAIVVKDRNFTPIHGLRIHGIQWEANNSKHNNTTSTGIKVSGDTLRFVNVQVHGFNWGVDLTNNDTYIISFDSCVISSCMVGLNADISNAWSDGTAADNSGERITFTNSLFANCGIAYWASGNGLGLFFVNTSFDFMPMWGLQRDANVFMDNCHLESSYGPDARHFMFVLQYGAHFNMVNCLFIMGSPGIYYVLDPGAHPSELGWSIAHFTSCNASYKETDAAIAAGAKWTGFSEPIVAVPVGATKITVTSMFASEWNAISVRVVAAGAQAQADVAARITEVNTLEGTVTVALSGPAPAGTFIELDF